LFVTQPFTAFGKPWAVEAPFPWEDLGLEYQDNVIHQLYESNFLVHRPDLEGQFIEEAKRVVGDGLEEMPLDAIHLIVEKINKSVRLKSRNEKEYAMKKCPFSRIKDKQIGLLRRWRLTYGHMED
jgi:hypothetical protein